MIKLLSSLSLFLVLVSSASAQTWGCPERDLKCQLDGRMKALKDDPKNPENYYDLGIVFQRSGAHKEAIESFSMYILIPGVKAESIADGYNNRGISHRALKNFEQAMADYTKAIELKPTDPMPLVNRANLHVQLKKTDLALADYANAVAVDPKYHSTYAQRGILLDSTGRTDDALKDFAKSIELEPAYAEPYYNRGTIYSGKKEYAKAIPDYEKYVTLVTDSEYLADGHMNLGIAHYYTGSLQEALDNFSKVIAIQPTRPNGYKARAMLYREMKKDDLAAADQRKVAELSAPPAQPSQSKTSFEYTAEGSKYYRDGDYKKAIPLYQKALDLEKAERKLEKKIWFVLVDNLAIAYGITGDIKSSQSVLEYGIKQEPTYPMFYYNMACGYGESDDEDNAIKYLRLAFKYKANMIEGEALPNPETDSSFERFRKSEKFKKAITEMKSGK